MNISENNSMLATWEYDRAARKYESTTPWRGTNTRPAGARHKKRHTIEKLAPIDNEGNCPYGYSLDGIRVVTLYPNGDVGLNCGGYHTGSTIDIINTYTNTTGIYAGRRQGRVWVTTYKGTWPLSHNSETLFKHVGYNALIPVHTIEGYKNVADRKADAALRKPYKAFIDWGVVTLNLCGGWLSPDTMRPYLIVGHGGQHLYCHNKTNQDVLDAARDEGRWTEALVKLFASRLHPRSIALHMEGNYMAPYTTKEFKYHMHDMLKAPLIPVKVTLDGAYVRRVQGVHIT